MTNVINFMGAWFAISLIGGIGFGAFCASGRGEYVKPLQVWLYERIINVLKILTNYQVTLENKVYQHKVYTHGHTDLVVSSTENDEMRVVIEGLAKEREKDDVRSMSLDAETQEGRIKNNPDQQKTFQETMGDMLSK